MGKYPTTNITLKGVEDKGLTIQILDEKNQKWTIWKADYENKNQDSEAYASFKNYHIGEQFGVEYGEKEESFQGREGNTVNFTRRTIYKSLPLVANPTVTVDKASSTPKTTNQSHSGASQGPSNDEFWEKKAYKQCLWNYWLNHISPSVNELNWMENVWLIFNDIEADANKRFSAVSEAKPTEPIDRAEQERLDNELAESIPFN